MIEEILILVIVYGAFRQDIIEAVALGAAFSTPLLVAVYTGVMIEKWDAYLSSRR